MNTKREIRKEKSIIENLNNTKLNPTLKTIKGSFKMPRNFNVKKNYLIS